MPLALLVIGLLAVVVAINGTQRQLAAQLASDFTGSGSFIYWIVAIAVLAMLGRVAGLENTAKAFIGLIVVVYLVSNTGVWTQAQNALSSLSAPGATSTQGTVTSAQGGNVATAQPSVQSTGGAVSSGTSTFTAGGL